MDIKKLQSTVVNALEDIKAQDIVLFDTTKLTSLFDRMVIASGTSNRQTKALAASVRDKVKEAGGTIVGVEGADTGEWVLVDLGDMIVHIMQPAIRAYYQLEEIWGGKPIALASAKRVARKSAPAAGGKAAAKPAARKPAAKAAAPEGKKAAPRKTAAKTGVAAKKTATRKKTAAADSAPAAKTAKPKASSKRAAAKQKPEE